MGRQSRAYEKAWLKCLRQELMVIGKQSGVDYMMCMTRGEVQSGTGWNVKRDRQIILKAVREYKGTMIESVLYAVGMRESFERGWGWVRGVVISRMEKEIGDKMNEMEDTGVWRGE